MRAAFNNILVPVDFSINTEIAVQKAIGLIGTANASIQLLHVVRIRKQTTPRGKYEIHEAEEKLMQWNAVLKDSLPDVEVTSRLEVSPSVQPVIVQAARDFHSDLVIIGRQGDRRRWPFFPTVSPDAIACKTDCPVLTAKPGSFHHKTRLIVVPVQDFVPERRLELAVIIARKFRAQIHLILLQDGSGSPRREPSQAFIRTYHQLREKLHHPIEFSAVPLQNAAKAALNYAESVMADMILVNPEKHITDLLARDSKIQVLEYGEGL
jgi:nucleotide-binding universal stress UspA family protein